MNRGSLAKDWYNTFLTNSIMLVCGTLTGIIAARTLHPAGRGALAAVIIWPQIITYIGIFGLNEAVTFHISRFPKKKSIITSSAIVLALLISLLLSFGTYWLIPWLLGENRVELYELAKMYAVIYVPLGILSMISLAVIHGELRFRRFNFIRLLVPSIYLLLLLLLIGIRRINLSSVVMANMVAYIIMSAVALATLRRSIFTRPDISILKSLIVFGFRYFPAFALIAVSGFIDRALVLKLWGNETVGLYAVAFTFASSALLAISGTSGTVLFPHVAANKSPEERIQILTSGIRLTMLLLTITATLCALMAPWLIPALFGREFQGAVVLAILLIVAMLVFTMKSVVIRTLRGLGEGTPGTVSEVTSILCFLLFAIPLVQIMNVYGVAISLLLANMLAFAYLLGHIKKTYGVEVRQLFGLKVETMVSLFGLINTHLIIRRKEGKKP